MLHLLALAHATPGQLTLPLDQWTQLQPKPPKVQTPSRALPLSRRLVGTIENGLLEARLSTRVRALAPVSLAVLPREVTLTEATLDGRPASLSLAEVYAVDLEAGVHDLQLDLLQGQASDRSERRVHLDLPDGGATAFELTLPEAPIDVTLAHGIVTESTAVPGGTRVRGWLDGSADLDLSWERRATHATTTQRLDTEVAALFDLASDLVTGKARYEVQVLAGEVDRIALDLPHGVEITGVNGDQVLQWHTTSGALQVLLRSVVDESVLLDVAYQYPAHLDGPTQLFLPHPQGELHGSLGVVAPVALEVELATVEKAAKLDPRDVPQSLVELSATPLRVAVSFDEAPTVSATTTRQGEVLTSTSRIDDLQGITIVMEDGTEVGKLRLTVRNADQQVLTVDLPEGARLTHCFRDGSPLRPGTCSAPGFLGQVGV